MERPCLVDFRRPLETFRHVLSGARYDPDKHPRYDDSVGGDARKQEVCPGSHAGIPKERVPFLAGRCHSPSVAPERWPLPANSHLSTSCSWRRRRATDWLHEMPARAIERSGEMREWISIRERRPLSIAGESMVPREEFQRAWTVLWASPNSISPVRPKRAVELEYEER